MVERHQRRFLLALVLLTFFAVALFSARQDVSAAPAVDEPVRIMVKAPPGQDAQELADELAENFPAHAEQQRRGILGKLSEKGESAGTVKVKHVLKRSGLVAIEVPASVAKRLSAEGYSIQEDVQVHALLPDSVPLINATQVWAMLDTNGLNVTGKNITVAVLDTGINYSHPDLGGCNTSDYLAGNCKVIAGVNFVNSNSTHEDNDSMDDHGHGTHVAGIVAANGTLKGVAPDATLVAFKVLDSGGDGTDSDVLAAIERALDPDQDNDTSDHYDIISMSLGGLGNADDLMSAAVDDAVNAGAVVVVAAGNSGPNGQTNCRNGGDGSEYSICSPGTARLAITVGNTNKNDGLETDSSRGPNPDTLEIKPELTAPGNDIVSTSIDAPNESLRGTSMSAPHVSGAAALLKQLHPDWTPSRMKAVLVGTALDVGLNVTDGGAGRVHVLAATNATFISEPPVLSVKSRYNPLGNVSAFFNLSDISNSTYNVSLSVSLRESAGEGVPLLNASIVELPALGNVSVELYFVNLTENSTGEYSGLITANSSTNTISIPFWVRLNDCGVIDRDTTLTKNYNASMTCFYIDSSDVVLDGAGFTVTGGNADHGITSSASHQNITIRNFAGIINFTDGINIDNSGNVTISNNTIIVIAGSVRNAIYIEDSGRLNITGNIISVNNSAGNGMYLKNCLAQDSVITSNNVSVLNADMWGILLQNSPGFNVSDNDVYTDGSSTAGIYVLTSENTSIFGNSVTINGNNSNGIYAEGSHFSTLASNSVSTSCGICPGMYIFTSNFTTLSGNNVTTYSDQSAALFLTESDHTIASSNTLTTTGTSSEGLYLFESMDNNTFTSTVINTSASVSVGIRLFEGTGNTFSGGTIGSLLSPELRLVPLSNRVTSIVLGGGLNFTSHSFVNISVDANTTPPADPGGKRNLSLWFNLASIGGASAIDFNLSYSDSDVSGIDESTVQLYRYNESSGAWEVVGTSSIDTGNNTVVSGNISSDFGLYAPLGDIQDTCEIVNQSKTLLSNITTIGDCLVIGASNIIIDGAGFTITGNGSGIGISSTGNFDNYTLKNFGGINNFSTGIKLVGTNNNLIFIYNNSITSEDAAIFFQTIINSNITGNILRTTGSGSSGVTLWGSWGNILDSNTISSTANNSVGITLNQSITTTHSNNIISVNGSGSSHGVDILASAGATFSDIQLSSANSYEIFTESTGIATSTYFTKVLLAGTVNFTSHSIWNVSIDVNTTPPPNPSGKRNLSDYLTIVNSSNNPAFIDFNLSYSDSDVSGIDESTVQLYRYNESSAVWEIVSGSSVDTASNTVASGNISSDWGLFAPFGDMMSSLSYSAPLNVTPVTFDSTGTLNFSINWTSNLSITGVSIEVNRSGTVTTHVASNMTDATLWNLTLSGFPAGTHYWRSNATDINGNTNLTGWYSFTIAKATPTLNLTLNGTEGNVTINVNTSIWLNGSVVAGDGGALIEIFLNGTEIGVGTAVANLTTFSSIGLYNITLYYTETDNYTTTTVTYFVTAGDLSAPVVSSHLPTGTVTSSSTTLTATTDENATCRYSTSSGTAYASMTGVMAGSATSHTASLTGLATGTYHYYIRCNDSSGNVATSDYDATVTVSIATTPPSSGGGGGGSPTTTTTGTTATSVISSVSKESGIRMSINKDAIPVSKITVKVTDSATNVEITVSAHDDKPDSVQEAPKTSAGSARTVYNYLEIGHENLAGKIASATIEFKVAKAWLTNNSLDKERIMLQRYSGSTWVDLPTEISKETAANVYYNATTTQFSVFVISVKDDAVVEAEEEPEGELGEEPAEEEEQPRRTLGAGQPVEEQVQSSVVPLGRSIFQSGLFTLAVATVLATTGIGFIYRNREIVGAKIQDLLSRLESAREERLRQRPK